MKKADIETLELAGKVYPAVRIRPDLPLLPRVESEDIEKAWVFIEESFWLEFVPQLVADIFGDTLATFSAGDENEWLCIGDLAPVQVWPALMVNKWRSLESRIRIILDDITKPSYFFDTLEALGIEVDRTTGQEVEPEEEGPVRGKGYINPRDLTFRQYMMDRAVKK
jgi:hypothetical protein